MHKPTRTRAFRYILWSLFIVLSVPGCGKKDKKKPNSTISLPAPEESTTEEDPSLSDSSWDSDFGERDFGERDLGNAGLLREEPLERTIPGDDIAAVAAQLKRIHFPYDQSNLTPEARDVLAQNAEILRRNPGMRVELSGHCDERGSTDYNMALGERRAQTVYRYMLSLGLEGSRVRTTSYGEDRPLSFGSTEYDYALNRRVEFRPMR